MNRIITKHELWNLSNEQIAELTKGKFVRIVKIDGTEQEILVKNLLAAANPPHPFVGFMTESNHSVHLMDIDHVEL
jgi:hypothetical protein